MKNIQSGSSSEQLKRYDPVSGVYTIKLINGENSTVKKLVKMWLFTYLMFLKNKNIDSYEFSKQYQYKLLMFIFPVGAF